MPNRLSCAQVEREGKWRYDLRHAERTRFRNGVIKLFNGNAGRWHGNNLGYSSARSSIGVGNIQKTDSIALSALGQVMEHLFKSLGRSVHPDRTRPGVVLPELSRTTGSSLSSFL